MARRFTSLVSCTLVVSMVCTVFHVLRRPPSWADGGAPDVIEGDVPVVPAGREEVLALRERNPDDLLRVELEPMDQLLVAHVEDPTERVEGAGGQEVLVVPLLPEEGRTVHRLVVVRERPKLRARVRRVEDL